MIRAKQTASIMEITHNFRNLIRISLNLDSLLRMKNNNVSEGRRAFRASLSNGRRGAGAASPARPLVTLHLNTMPR